MATRRRLREQVVLENTRLLPLTAYTRMPENSDILSHRHARNLVELYVG